MLHAGQFSALGELGLVENRYQLDNVLKTGGSPSRPVDNFGCDKFMQQIFSV